MNLANAYSSQWFELFLETQQFMALELEFLIKHLPNPPYLHVLDVGCGQGRHANPLGNNGYKVIGVDIH